jgi:hypothetical protein
MIWLRKNNFAPISRDFDTWSRNNGTIGSPDYERKTETELTTLFSKEKGRG